MSKNFPQSFSCSRSHKIYIRSNKIKLGSTYAYHALWPLSYDLEKIQDRNKSANRCNGGITLISYAPVSWIIIPPLNKVEVLVSPCPSVRQPSRRLSICPSVDRIVSALYLPQYSTDPFHIYTAYQATSEGVWSFFFFKIWSFGKFFKFVTLTLSCFDFGSNMTQ